jgi:hypothetical protein
MSKSCPGVTSMSHAVLCERGRRWLGDKARCPIVLVEFVTRLGEIPDVIGFRNEGMDSIVIECKASRGDFLRDAKKRHRQQDTLALGSYRYFLSEPGVIQVADLPARWGLLWVTRKSIELLAGADPRRHYWPPETDVWRWPALKGEQNILFNALLRAKMSLGAAAFRRCIQATYPRAGIAFEASDNGRANVSSSPDPSHITDARKMS